MSLWDAILKDAGAQVKEGETGSTSQSTTSARAPNKQILIVGPCYAGKRTLASRLRESSGDKRGTNQQQQQHGDDEGSPARGAPSSSTTTAHRSGGGIDHSFVDVRSEEGQMLATVELFVLDSPGVIPVVLPTAQSCQNAMVIFAVDLSAPGTALDTFDHWVSSLNDHVTRVAEEAGPGGHEEVRNLRIKEWSNSSTMFKGNRQRAYDALKQRTGSGGDGAMPSNTVVLDQTAICLLPSVVLGCKLDQYEKYCRGKSDPSHSEIGTLPYGIEVLRKRALDMRSGFASLSLLSSSASATAALKGLWYWSLVECLKIQNISIPEPAGGGSFADESMAGSFAKTRTQTLEKKATAQDTMSSSTEVLTAGFTIWAYLDPLICFEVEDSSVFVPQGADLYELLSGFVRTSDGVASWSSFFPPPTLKRPKISSHTDTLHTLKEKLSSDDSAQGDMWDL